MSLRFWKRTFFLTLFLVGQGLSSAAGALPENFLYPVQRKNLPNGVQILTAQVKHLPLVTVQVWIQAGSAFEENSDEFGIAHFLEHLTYESPAQNSHAPFEIALEQIGASFNAYTYRDALQFQLTGRSDSIERLLQLEFDRLKNFPKTDESIEKVRRAISQERKLTIESSLGAQLYERSWSAFYEGTPYGHPVIGTPESLARFSRVQIVNWWDRAYVGNKLLVTVVGDFNPASILKTLQSTFGTLPAGSSASPPHIMPRLVPPPPSFQEGRSSNIIARLALATVPAADNDTFSLDVLSELLHEGPESTLHRKLVSDLKIAHGVTGHHGSARNGGLFQSEIIFAQGVEPEQILPSYLQAIQEGLNAKTIAADLRRVKREYVREWWKDQDSIRSIATMLSLNQLLMGHYNRWLTDLYRYEKVSIADLKALVPKYFQPQRIALHWAGPKIEKGPSP